MNSLIFLITPFLVTMVLDSEMLWMIPKMSMTELSSSSHKSVIFEKLNNILGIFKSWFSEILKLVLSWSNKQ